MARESATYIHGHHESVLRSHSWRTAENSAAYLLPHLKADHRILDIGCGPGTITADLAERVPNGHVTGADRAETIVDQSRNLTAERCLTNVDFTVADVHALEFEDDTFDIVHAHQVLQHVGDPVQALEEMRRVTKPGGIVAARDSDYAAFTWFPGSRGLTDWLDLYERVARAGGGEPDAGRRLKSWALKAGFSEASVEATSSTWTFANEEDRRWWGDLWKDRSLHSDFAKQAVAGGHAVQEELQAISDAWKAWGEAEESWLMIPHGEILCRASIQLGQTAAGLVVSRVAGSGPSHSTFKHQRRSGGEPLGREFSAPRPVLLELQASATEERRGAPARHARPQGTWPLSWENTATFTR
ncbi:methyltransferase domain-containing protein [Glycomyces buryatensis]|uniref:Methyltransferase domain-containing protein n=1 Tax=Glycomyces buryatensis TaxID=2570927 RepID=A0A4S8QF97_9ACTN|nr:class I SAM-dependent methyltransferase [Glycomyces buryatensis]THV43293.1 methyltransferase domain-containing protein [Glycomyces buryatensis]